MKNVIVLFMCCVSFFILGLIFGEESKKEDFYDEIYEAMETIHDLHMAIEEDVNTIEQERNGWEKIAFEFRDESEQWRMKYVRLRDEHYNCGRFFINTTNFTKAKLNDGSIVEYDVCANSSDAYDPNNFRFIGRGIIYSVNNVVQKSTKERCFYRKLF